MWILCSINFHYVMYINKLLAVWSIALQSLIFYNEIIKFFITEVHMHVIMLNKNVIGENVTATNTHLHRPQPFYAELFHDKS